jgi:hypothetical protein
MKTVQQVIFDDEVMTAFGGGGGGSRSTPTFFQAAMPAHTAPFVRQPIGGSTSSQIQWANTVNPIRTTAISTGAFHGGRGVDLATNQMISRTANFVSTPRR